MRMRVEKLKVSEGRMKEIEKAHSRRKQEKDEKLHIRQEEIRTLREQEHQLMLRIKQHELTLSQT
ncbi:hypothetical protein DPMN_140258 [Dreissena polymorpha]|uniref:Uncharacterized protein n=1 Tax=Dreissena polymorpha TaxID=45954 RepID=A0A9D4G7U3_DREPO|nr:hypothetical protein DPMN_140258 [Dreissena polymorpha]